MHALMLKIYAMTKIVQILRNTAMKLSGKKSIMCWINFIDLHTEQMCLFCRDVGKSYRAASQKEP